VSKASTHLKESLRLNMIIKGLVFDLDGVITETTQLHYLAWKMEVKKIGIEFNERENSTLKGLSRIDTLKAILKMKGLGNKYSESEMNAMASTKNDFYKELLKKEVSEKNILPNIKNFLNSAKKAGLKMSIASSSFNAPKILDKVKLRNYFDFIVNPGDLKNGKPNPEIYLRACKGMGLKPSEVIGFEDAIAGIHGLNRANIKSVAIT
jgi:beta-phosphoglucomutase